MHDKDWHREETYKSLVTISNNGIKFVLIINGGAIIALLTFLGNLLNKYGTIDMSFSFILYVAGIVLAGIAQVTAYITQLKLFNEYDGSSKHTPWLYLTMILLVLGIASFAIGSLCALSELQLYAKK